MTPRTDAKDTNDDEVGDTDGTKDTDDDEVDDQK